MIELIENRFTSPSGQLTTTSPSLEFNKHSVRVQVRPTDDSTNISIISVKCNLNLVKLDICINVEESNFVNFHISSGSCDEEVSLLTILKRLISSLSLDASEQKSIFNISPDSDVKQAMINNFLSGLSVYLALLILLLDERTWDIIPFRFSLPVCGVDGKCLNQEVFNVLMFPFRAILDTSSDSKCNRVDDLFVIKAMIKASINFFNVWGSFFDMGLPINQCNIMMETVSGYTSYIIRSLSDIIEGRGFMSRLEAIEGRLTAIEDQLRCN